MVQGNEIVAGKFDMKIPLISIKSARKKEKEVMLRSIIQPQKLRLTLQQRTFVNIVSRTPVYDAREWEGNALINDQVNVLKDINPYVMYAKDLQTGNSKRVFDDKDMPPRYMADLIDTSKNNTALYPVI